MVNLLSLNYDSLIPNFIFCRAQILYQNTIRVLANLIVREYKLKKDTDHKKAIPLA